MKKKSCMKFFEKIIKNCKINAWIKIEKYFLQKSASEAICPKSKL